MSGGRRGCPSSIRACRRSSGCWATVGDQGGEEIEQLGYEGGKTILDDLLRDLRPRHLPPPRSCQRKQYRPGELAQFDLCEPRAVIPVGWGQTRRGYIVACKLPYSRAFAGAVVFIKEFCVIASWRPRAVAALRRRAAPCPPARAAPGRASR